MKTMTYLASPLPTQSLTASPASPLAIELAQPLPNGSRSGEPLRHILLGSPGAVRQTIHLLHTLHYAETVLWSPIMAIEEPLIITPAQGEAMSLLRRWIR